MTPEMAPQIEKGQIVEIDGYKIEVLLTEPEIDKRIVELADQIDSDYLGKKLKVIMILKGASSFGEDLIRELGKGNSAIDRKPRDIEIDYKGTTSYGSKTTTSGEVKDTISMDSSIKDEDVLVVEDILDTGKTLLHVVNKMSEEEPKSLNVCVLLDKKERRIVNINAKYVGFDIQNVFVVGRGLDYKQKFRNLRFVGILLNPDKEEKIN